VSPRVEAVFFDLDGVILDPARTGAEWERLVGEFFAPRLGGSAADWALANRRIVPGLFEVYVQPVDGDPSITEAQYGLAWVRGLCRELGVTPPSEQEAVRLWRAAEVHVCAQTTAAFACTGAIIEALGGKYGLHTASGNFSWRVDALLTQLGVIERFGVRSGPDVVGAAKHSTRFYERTFAAAGIEARFALVVDDDARQLDLAASLGARTALIGAADAGAYDLVLGGIEELPAALEGLWGAGFSS
jgi:phosphoglycolate phosphatase-like HAD superfamily hydrolase